MKLKKKSNKFYDFWRDGVTQSMVQKWLACPRQAYLEYVEGWTPYQQSDALLFGNVCHHVLEHAYTGESAPLPGNVRALITGFQESMYSGTEKEPCAETQSKNEFLFKKAETLLNTYFIQYSKDWENNWLFTERTFKIPYVYPDGKTTFLQGKIDGAFVEKIKVTGKNELWVPDHKTSSRPDPESVSTLLPVDLQVWFYLYATTQLPEFKGKKISGFCYNMLRNPGLKMTQKDGTLQEYSNRLYTDIISRTDFYFHRENIRIKMSEIRAWKVKQLDPIMRAIRRWHESNYTWPAYFSPSALKTVYGLAPMTKAIVSNDFTGLYQRETPFQEL